MADNQIVIRVTSENDTRGGFDAAKRDAADAGDQAGQGFATRFVDRMLAGLSGQTSGQGFGPGLASAVQGLIGLGPAAGPVLGAGVVGLGALLNEIGGLITGFAAAGAGAIAFGALSHGTISTAISDYTALTTAQTNLQTAQTAYQQDPTKANANAVTKAQDNLKQAQQQFAQDAGPAAGPIQAVAAAWNNATSAFQPTGLNLMAEALKPIPGLIQAIVPMAQAFASALDPLLGRFDRFAQSRPFHQFLENFTKDIGPATTAIGSGIGQLFGQFGALFKVMSPHDVVHAINIAFDTITGILIAVRYVVEGTMKVWDLMSGVAKQVAATVSSNWERMSGAFKEAWDNVKKWTGDAVHWLETTVPGEMFTAASKIIEGFIRGLTTGHTGILGAIQSIGGGIIGELDRIFHFGSPSRTMIDKGRNVTEGFRIGLQENAQNLHLGGAVTGGGGGAVVLQITGGGTGLDALFIEWLKQAVMRRGGGGKNSVQIALGQAH